MTAVLPEVLPEGEGVLALHAKVVEPVVVVPRIVILGVAQLKTKVFIGVIGCKSAVGVLPSEVTVTEPVAVQNDTGCVTITL